MRTKLTHIHGEDLPKKFSGLTFYLRIFFILKNAFFPSNPRLIPPHREEITLAYLKLKCCHFQNRKAELIQKSKNDVLKIRVFNLEI